MALTESKQIELGSLIKKFSLKGTDDQIYTHDSWEDAKVMVIVFMCNHCPYVQAVWSRMIKLQNGYKYKNVQFIGINSNDDSDFPEDSFENMKKYVVEKGQNFPYLRDETQEVAKEFGAVCTPEIFVYSGDRMLVYHGRFDDNWRDESKVQSHDLKDAIDSVLAGVAPREGQISSMGCSIKWKGTFL